MAAPNTSAAAKCHQPSAGPQSVGIFYASANRLSLRPKENGEKQPFPQFGTPIATLWLSTWFHANEGAVQRFSGPAAPPLLHSNFRADQLLQLASFEHLHHDLGPPVALTLYV